MSNKRRIKKGIESIEKQIALHKKKLADAVKAGNIGLAKYYEKEIEGFEKTKFRKGKRLLK